MELKKHGKSFLDYLIKTFNGMALGLFATLIIGTIIGTIGDFFTVGSLINTTLGNIGEGLKQLTGVGIGLGVAWSLKLDGLKLITAVAAGGLAVYLSGDVGFAVRKYGDPLVIYLVTIITIELSKLVLRKKTPVDIIIIPLFVGLVAGVLTLLINQPVSFVTSAIGSFVTTATDFQPFIMGIVIAVVMGMALTAPISSAAIAITISIGGNPELGTIAAGASVVGCSVQMIGFAVMSRKDNNIGTVLSVAFGTSMLQFKNILRKPIIWLPTIIASAILGPIATVILQTRTNSVGAGMGTSGLVGQINIFSVMTETNDIVSMWISIIGLCIIAPIILVFILDTLFRKYGLIKDGDLKI